MSKSKIEWTEQTWNPVTGCSKVSAGCKHCYAERMTARLQAMGVKEYQKGFGNVRVHSGKLDVPIKKYKNPTMFFVNSMSDLFHEDVPFEFVDEVFAVMALTPHHTYQVLTKRPKRMHEYLEDYLGNVEGYKNECYAWIYGMREIFGDFKQWPLPNVWLGVSVEDQKTADERIALLLECPAAVRFVSYEPALGPVDLDPWFVPYKSWDSWGIDWVICGGESGPGARPMHPDWARSVRDQCVASGVPFFFKQWGEWAIDHQMPDQTAMETQDWKPGYIFYDPNGLHAQDVLCHKVGKKRAGRLLDGREWNEMPRMLGGKSLWLRCKNLKH